MKRLIFILLLFNLTASGQNFFFSHTTWSIPIVLTSSVSSIGYTTASCGGTVTREGLTLVTARGICWNTSINPTTANDKTTNGSGLGSFTSSLTGLSNGTQYYVRAYATNGSTTTYGDNVIFTTLAYAVPIVTTTAITAIRRSTATGGGNVTSDGGLAVNNRGICWNTTTNPTTYDYVVNSGTGTGVFTSYLTGLLDATTYYVRAWAANSMGVSYGDNVSFTTDPDPCTLSLGDSYGGGIIVYFLQPGDIGYDSGVCHGLIASTTVYSKYDLDPNRNYNEWGSYTVQFSTDQDILIGQGLANTMAMINEGTTTNSIAHFCYNLVLNGYDDWYLPSLNEAAQFYRGISTYPYTKFFQSYTGDGYWTSSPYNLDPYYVGRAYFVYGYNEETHQVISTDDPRSTRHDFRPIRSF